MDIGRVNIGSGFWEGELVVNCCFLLASGANVWIEATESWECGWLVVVEGGMGKRPFRMLFSRRVFLTSASQNKNAVLMLGKQIRRKRLIECLRLIVYLDI
ncbi:MAG: hypothetical protein AAF614_37175, partial [Chloroflexota bacterium]